MSAKFIIEIPAEQAQAALRLLDVGEGASVLMPLARDAAELEAMARVAEAMRRQLLRQTGAPA